MRNVGTALLLTTLAALAACGGGGLKTVDFGSLPVRSATKVELVTRINETALSITGIRAKARLGLRERALSEEKTCDCLLLGRLSPRKGLYLKGYRRLIPTFFTLVAGDEQFWLHIPGEDVVYTGPLEFTWSARDSVEFFLNAGDLVRALFLQPLEGGSGVTVREEGSSYIVTVNRGGGVSREVWLERKGFTVTREIYYDDNGNARLEILRKHYTSLDGRLYPARLELHDNLSGSAVYVNFTAITVDPDHMPDGAFRFEIPAGTDIRRVDNDTPVS